MAFFGLFLYQNKLKIMVVCRMLSKKLWIFSILGIYTNSISKNEYIQFVQNRESIFLPFKSYLFYMFSCVLGNFFRQFVIFNEILTVKCSFSCAICTTMYILLNNSFFIRIHFSKWLNYTLFSLLFILKNEHFKPSFFKMNGKSLIFGIIFQYE